MTTPAELLDPLDFGPAGINGYSPDRLRPTTATWPAGLPRDLYSDEPEMESDLHLRQLILLLSCLNWLWRESQSAAMGDRLNYYFAAGNLTIYYSEQCIKTRDFRGPDFFVVKNVDPRPRKSWVLWEEQGRYPDVIVEVLSDTTAKVDRTTKKALYQNTFCTPEYFWFDPDTLEFAGFALVDGVYAPIPPNVQGWMWSAELNLFLGIHAGFLRYFTPAGVLVPTPAEAALAAEAQLEQTEAQLEQAEAQLEQAEAQREQAEQRAERLAAQLKALNIEPDQP